MSSLTDLLSFEHNGSKSTIPQELALLLVDTLESPAQFLLSHFINLFLKDGLPCCVVSMNECLSHYNAISRKNVRGVVKRGSGSCNVAGRSTGSACPSWSLHFPRKLFRLGRAIPEHQRPASASVSSSVGRLDAFALEWTVLCCWPCRVLQGSAGALPVGMLVVS
jgi:hypothetical protein